MKLCKGVQRAFQQTAFFLLVSSKCCELPITPQPIMMVKEDVMVDDEYWGRRIVSSDLKRACEQSQSKHSKAKHNNTLDHVSTEMRREGD